MKKRLLRFTNLFKLAHLALLAFLLAPFFTSAVNYSGTYTIGTSGTWTNLTNAFTAISAGTVTGNINLELSTGYTSTGETFPIAPSTNNGTYTVAIYPNISGLSITSSNTTGTLNLNGCDYYTIDGRVNQSGSMDLIIANTSTSGFAIRFINDANYNTVRYCNVQGVATSVTTGVILFSTPSSAGNDYNTVEYCSIHEGSSNPYACVVSVGTAGSENNNNTVSNNNIYNFYNAAGASVGVYLSTGNTDWTISGNSVYQTATRTPTAGASMYPIYINSSGNNYTVSSNYIGGSAASCGGSALSFAAAATQNCFMYCITLNAGTTSASKIESNVISNISYGSLAGTASTYSFAGIVCGSGYVDIKSNTIGSGTGTGSLAAAYSTSSTEPGVVGGIYAGQSQGTVSYNTIGSITMSGGGTGENNTLYGIDALGTLTADFTISNNTIGSTSTSSSIQYSTTTASRIAIIGIYSRQTVGYTSTISDNTIQNIHSASTSTNGNTIMYGIYASPTSVLLNVSRNTLANLTTAKPTTGGLVGIYFSNTTAGQIIADNTLKNISNTYTGATAVNVYGLYYAGPTTGTNSIARNNIFNITSSGTSASTIIYGMYMASGVASVNNNMLTLGNSVTASHQLFGVYHASTTAGTTYYFNSIYFGGTVSSGATYTYAMYTGVTATRTLQNNIFYNARSGGTGRHYAIAVSSTTGLTSNYNELYSSTAANLGSYNSGTTARTFSAWQTGTSQDANSLNSDPVFTDPTNATTPDLHVGSTSPVLSAGLSGTGITLDIDNDIRSSTPDIGADEAHTDYYSKSSGSLDLTSTWGTNTDGSGTNPPNFTTRNCNFYIWNNTAPTIAANWTVSGSGSTIILGDGTTAINFTIPASFACTGTVNIDNNATLTIQNTSVPTLNDLDVGSTVNYNSASGTNQTVSAAATYGNLILSNSTGSGSSTKTLSANVKIAGNLTVNSYATFDMVTFNANRIGGSGTLTLAANSYLKLSGTTGGASTNNNFPNNFSTSSISTTGTVEYYGATQTMYSVPTYGNLITSTSGTKTAGGSLTVAGDFTISSPSTFDGSSYTHYMKGTNFINNGTFTGSTSTVSFAGSAAQSISGTATTTFYNLNLNNSSGLTLSMPANVSNTLTLSSGLMTTTSTNILSMQSGSTAPALTAASTSYINGPMRYIKSTSGSSTLNIPIGVGGECRPAILTVNHSTTTQYNYNCQVFSGDAATAVGSTSSDLPATVDTISQIHYWSIDRTTSAGAAAVSTDLSGNQQIQLFFGTSDAVYSGNSLTIVKTTSGNTLPWIDIGGTALNTSGATLSDNNSTSQAGSVTSTSSPSAFTSFSYFTLGSKTTGGFNPLPIELLSFTGEKTNTGHLLHWHTASEVNNQYFKVERSADGINFHEIGSVNGAGTSNEMHAYEFPDNEPLPGENYYRLKQIDFGGSFTYSNVILLFSDEDRFVVSNPRPNPSADNFYLDLFTPKAGVFSLQLFDSKGSLVLSESKSVDNGGTTLSLAGEQLPKGVYSLRVIFNGELMKVSRLVKQ